MASNNEFEMNIARGNSKLQAAYYTASYLKGVFGDTNQKENLSKIVEVLEPLVMEEIIKAPPANSSGNLAAGVDWDVIEKEFLDYGIHSNVGDQKKIEIVNWFKSQLTSPQL